MTPEKFIHSHLIDCINIVCYLHQNINLFVITGISELNGFTLSHYGSSVLLSTLTLGITASEPRLDTGYWLDITRQDFHLLYDISLNPPGIKDRTCIQDFYFSAKSVPDSLVMKIARVTSDTRNFYLTYSAALQPPVVAAAGWIVVVTVSCRKSANAVEIAPTINPAVGSEGLHGPLIHVTC